MVLYLENIAVGFVTFVVTYSARELLKYMDSDTFLFVGNYDGRKTKLAKRHGFIVCDLYLLHYLYMRHIVFW